MNKALMPLQEKQQELRKQKDYVYDILNDGHKRAKEIADVTMAEVYDRIGIKKFH